MGHDVAAQGGQCEDQVGLVGEGDHVGGQQGGHGRV